MRGQSPYRDNIIDVIAPGNRIDGGAGNDQIRALQNDDTLLGGAGNDVIFGGFGNDLIEGGTGSDLLSGDAGNDVYRFGFGSGLDFLLNGTDDASDYDVIELAPGVDANDLVLARSDDALVLTLQGTEDQLFVLDHFGERAGQGNGGPIDGIRFADGTLWDRDAILARLGTDLPLIGIEYDGVRYTQNYGGGTYFIGSSGARHYLYVREWLWRTPAD